MPNIPIPVVHFNKMKFDYYRHLYATQYTLQYAVRKDSAEEESSRYGYDAHDDDEYDIYTLYYDGDVSIIEQSDEERGSPVNNALSFVCSTMEVEQKSIVLTRIPAYIYFYDERYSVRKVDFKPRKFSSSIQTIFIAEREEGQKV